MKNSNLPKFLKDDIPLFNALIKDLFPGTWVPETDYGDFQDAIVKTIVGFGYQPLPECILKVIQLHETFNVRFGVMLVGPSGSGKSSCYRTLCETLKELSDKEDDLKREVKYIHFSYYIYFLFFL